MPLFPNRPIHDCFEQIRKIRRRIDVRLVQHLYSLNNFRSITTVNHHILRRVNLLAEYPVVPVHFEVLQNLQLVLRQMHRRFLILHLVERVFRYLQVGPQVHCGHLIHDSKEVDVCLIWKELPEAFLQVLPRLGILYVHYFGLDSFSAHIKAAIKLQLLIVFYKLIFVTFFKAINRSGFPAQIR